MFGKLIASASPARRTLWNPWVVGLSVGAHALVGAIVWSVGRDARVEAAENPERVTFIDVSEIPPPPEPEEVFADPAVEPPPPASGSETPASAPRATPRQPRPTAPEEPAPTRADEPAGFQELQIPDSIQGIPPPRVDLPPVRAEDFGGRGVRGGTAAGTPPPDAGQGGAAGSGTGPAGAGSEGGTPGGTGPPSTDRTYTSGVVDRVAELRNRGDIVRILARNYPAALKEAGISGRVVIRFVVGLDGRVEPGSAEIVSSTHSGFERPTLAAVREFRFTPAQVGSTRVRMLTQMPIVWELQR